MTRDLEYRVAKLERALKNEFLFSSTPKNSDAAKFVNNLFKAQPSLSNILYVVEGDLSKLSDARKNGKFKITLSIDPSKVKNADKYNKLSFYITVPNGKSKNDMVCTAFDDYDESIAKIGPFDLNKDVNKVAEFIKNQITFAKQKYKIEGFSRKLENIQLSMFDCEMIVDLINDKLESIGDYVADYADNNAEYGLLNIGMYANNKYLTEYNITAEEFDSFDISDENDRSIGNAASFKDIADIIVNHFKKNYI